ncbi:golgi uridine diphosphate-N- acetylglucosamine transporter [Malassezia vespertilionis]|uniref:Yea4p n=1 Tax=Malassezia vespertilionis TaxID=2020962 RepID=A0A2N1JDZ0_9BASI|nr:golgi uridine diphosphate-N- acetylglucosamine transporter [Malassezia vespertilionis]PKI84777.1 Yea4p [Malassezia vespertilionis]WFD05576.1 golgi uridine diphosphate-N- acetylglucosamine transporter [Malassezia vespertilionis]
MDFGPVFALIFGGCCSNAWTLERSMQQLPTSGTLMTFVQFVATALVALPGELTWRRWHGVPIVWLKTPQIPIRRWLVQVVLYSTTSILNNTAFAFTIPMSVHIVFRSGGMVVNMVLGWAIAGRRYNFMQIISVALVSAGVLAATLAAAAPSKAEDTNTGRYAMGVFLLSLALLSSGVMGIFQERTYARYGHQHWHEALFYTHLFSLPLFLLNPGAIRQQFKDANMTPKHWIGYHGVGAFVPSYYTMLTLNVLTQLLCINGVNRLTASVSSLSVSLVLVVRKAVSLVISVVILNGDGGNFTLWAGSTAVMVGTLGYTYGGLREASKEGKERVVRDASKEGKEE